MADTNGIGEDGERYTAIRLSQNRIFEVIQLGGKVPAYDLICKINDANKPYQFLVQVKAIETAPIFTKTKPNRIKTPVAKDKYEALQKLSLPTYVAGVDINTGDVYISAAYSPNNQYGGSISTTYHLSGSNLIRSKCYLTMLKHDVITYWDGLNINTYKPAFNTIII